ncbi:MAG: CoA-binding protein [Betaproteobacteria bacterium]|jgi:predicted CoA-binding protein|nr:CoA-binding protein [Betaproteobacteria bacterium]
MSTTATNPSDAVVRELLRKARTIAVVGLSNNVSRPSHMVAAYLQQHGYRILPVNPQLVGQTVLGEPCVAQLEDLHEPVDIVDVFRRTEDVLPVAASAVAIGARCLWQQLGVAHVPAAEQVQSAGLVSVMDRCLKIEHARLMA